MEQRRLRLGDILDDYCPRERRVTNHAVVAMIEEDVKQTRCTTCDAEHAYKGGKAPRRRRKDEPGALYNEVLAGMPDTEAVPILAPRDPESEPEPGDAPFSEVAPPLATMESDDSPDDATAPEPEPEMPDEGPVHRPLIRATLPRPEGQKDARPIPEFTIRQPGGRPAGNFRGGDRMKGRGGPGANGNRMHGGGRGQGFGGPRSGHGRGGQGRGGPGGGGFRSGQQPRHGGKKRSR